MKNKKSNAKVGKAVAVGAGIVAVGATAYMLLGPNGKKNRQKVTKFAKDAKKEILAKGKDAKKLVGVIKKATMSMEKKGVRKVTQATKIVKKAVKKAVK